MLLKNRIPCPVEVKYQIQPYEIPAGLKKFMSRYKNAKEGIVDSTNLKGEMEYDNRLIKFIKWYEAGDIEFLKNE